MNSFWEDGTESISNWERRAVDILVRNFALEVLTKAIILTQNLFNILPDHQLCNGNVILDLLVRVNLILQLVLFNISVFVDVQNFHFIV